MLQLLRISALPTLLSNVLAAYFIGSGNDLFLLLLLLISMSSIYLGGMVLNDYFDSEIDSIERPERPIPSGKISLQTAFALGMSLLSFGVVIGFICPFISGGSNFEKQVAIVLITVLFCCVISYNAFLKRMSLIGPVIMGTCRILCYLFVFFNVERNVLISHTIFSVCAGIYIMCLTMLSRFESNSPRIQKNVSLALSLLIPIDAVACLFFVGIIPALLVIALYPSVILLRRYAAMT
ncbi:MAG: UbiA family prenyltransferase [Planctomycetaceae bacterium]|jgi:4-hydroxybenzoate polyprenyltransferase|nr:UbiA family prenyltransferase [Planctomycetaceae bacterium]